MDHPPGLSEVAIVDAINRYDRRLEEDFTDEAVKVTHTLLSFTNEDIDHLILRCFDRLRIDPASLKRGLMVLCFVAGEQDCLCIDAYRYVYGCVIDKNLPPIVRFEASCLFACWLRRIPAPARDELSYMARAVSQIVSENSFKYSFPGNEQSRIARMCREYADRIRDYSTQSASDNSIRLTGVLAAATAAIEGPLRHLGLNPIDHAEYVAYCVCSSFYRVHFQLPGFRKQWLFWKSSSCRSFTSVWSPLNRKVDLDCFWEIGKKEETANIVSICRRGRPQDG